jgi:hypothetical protein
MPRVLHRRGDGRSRGLAEADDRRRHPRRPRLRSAHYDFYAQALAKIERGEQKDLGDVREMLARRLIEPARAWDLFRAIEPKLYRFPAIDPARFRRAVGAALGPSPH